MAARVAIDLAGGRFEPGSPLQTNLPAPLERFLQSCVLVSPNMRPGDAWELREEFSDLLEDVYGPPRYQHLVMS